MIGNNHASVAVEAVAMVVASAAVAMLMDVAAIAMAVQWWLRQWRWCAVRQRSAMNYLPWIEISGLFL